MIGVISISLTYENVSLIVTFYRKKYEGKYPSSVPTASFKGNYGTLRVSTMDQAKAFTDRENETETEHAKM